MIRLVLYPALLVFFADMLRRAFIVHADSLLLPIAGVVFLLAIGTARAWRRTVRRLTRNRIGFVRPRSFPAQRKRDVR